MRDTHTLTGLFAEIDRIEKAKEDYVVPATTLRMIGDHSIRFGKEWYELTPHAHGQLATYTGIPKRYYDRMGEVEGLRGYNVNAWLEQEQGRRMVRTLDGRARAIVSDRFRPIDNWLVVRAFLPVLEDFPGAQFKARVLSGTKMYLQIVFPGLTGEVKPGDTVQYGVTLSNSEVGAGAVDVKAMIWRLVCRNGMVGTSVVNRRHVGTRLSVEDGEFSEFADDTIAAEIKSFQLRLRDSLRAALTEKAFERELRIMQGAAAEEVVKPTETVERVTKRYEWLTDEDSERIFAGMVREKDFSRWGLANAITAITHEVSDRDRQYEYERAGYDLIHAPESEWRQLVA